MDIDHSRPAAPLSPLQAFFPRDTVNCIGPAVFRTQVARDAACLLDVDETVISWSCQSRSFSRGKIRHIPDFIVERTTGTYVVDILGSNSIPSWMRDAAESAECRYQLWSEADFPPLRLKNAKDLLRYARYETSLVDRVLLLAALAEAGSLRLVEAISMASGTRAIPVIASMILNRQIAIELDEELIGPDSIIRRFQY